MISFLLFGILNLLVLANSTMLTFLFSERKTHWKKIVLSISIWYFVLIFVSELSLGFFSLLQYQWLWNWHETMSIILLPFFFLKKKHWKYSLPNFSVENIFWATLLLLPWFGILCVRFWNAVFQVPLEYDSLSYHLPFIAEWLQTKTIWSAYYTAFSGPIGYYPSNFELFGLWSMMPFTSDLLIHFINIPVFILFIIAFLGIGKRLHLSTVMSIAAAALFLYMPQTFRQMGIPLVDIFFCYTFAASLFFLLEYKHTKSSSDFFLLSLSLGLFMGTKYLAVPYSVPLLLLGFGFLILQKKNIFFHHIKNIILGTFGILLGGGFWYIRNYLTTGNPLFPTELPWFEGYLGMAKKLESTSLIANIDSWNEAFPVMQKIYLMIGTPAFAIAFAMSIGIIGLIIALGLYFFTNQKQYKNFILTSLAFLFALVLYGGLYLYAPYTFQDVIPNVRYAMIFLLLGSLFFGYIFSRLWWTQCIMLAITLYLVLYTLVFEVIISSPFVIGNDKMVISYQHVQTHSEYFWIFTFSIIGFIVAFLLLLYAGKKIIFFGIIFFSSSFGFINAISVMQPFRESLAWSESVQWYGSGVLNVRSLALLEAAYWMNMQKITDPIAYAGFNLHYPFFGRNLERKVDYVNINECFECTYKDYANHEESIRRDASFEHWVGNLKTLEKKYLVVAKNINPLLKNYELEWASENANVFSLVYEKNDVFIFTIQ